MIDNFSGIDIEGEWGGGDIMVFAIEGMRDDSFFFFKGQVESPILHNTRDGSEFYVPYFSHYM